MKNVSQSTEVPQRLVKKTFIKFIRNSVGTKMFRNFYLRQDNKIFDATKGGELSCAFYVSGILAIFGLIKNIHGTVKSTKKDLEESGWVEVEQPTSGSVIIWKPSENDQDQHDHIGFYVGRNMAISNNSSRMKITKHNWTYDNTRKIQAIYYNPTLDKLI